MLMETEETLVLMVLEEALVHVMQMVASYMVLCSI